MDKMRDEFEVAYVMHVCGCDAIRAAKRIEDMGGDGLLARHSKAYDYKYCQQSTDDAWWAWQASRSALCVKLPTIHKLALVSEPLMDADEVKIALEDAGVRYE